MYQIIVFLILLGIYVGVTLLAYKYIQASYSKGGIFELLSPEGGDLFLTFMPVFNMCPAISYLIGSCYRNRKKKGYLNKFYKIKK